MSDTEKQKGPILSGKLGMQAPSFVKSYLEDMIFSEIMYNKANLRPIPRDVVLDFFRKKLKVSEEMISLYNRMYGSYEYLAPICVSPVSYIAQNPELRNDPAVRVVNHSRLVPTLRGAPGQGKTAIIHSIAEKMSAELKAPFRMEVFYLTHVEPEDLTGIMNVRFTTIIVEGEDSSRSSYIPRTLEWARDKSIPYDDNFFLLGTYGILFLDEYNRAKDTVLRASLKLLDGTSLLQSWFIVLAGNLGGRDNTEVTDVYDAARSRRYQYMFLVNAFNSWVPWARQNGVPEVLLKFLSRNPSVFSSSFPIHGGMTRDLNPATWTKVGTIIRQAKAMWDRKNFSDLSITRTYRSIYDYLFVVLQGVIGKRLSKELVQFIQDYDKNKMTTIEPMDFLTDYSAVTTFLSSFNVTGSRLKLPGILQRVVTALFGDQASPGLEVGNALVLLAFLRVLETKYNRPIRYEEKRALTKVIERADVFSGSESLLKENINFRPLYTLLATMAHHFLPEDLVVDNYSLASRSINYYMGETSKELATKDHPRAKLYEDVSAFGETVFFVLLPEIKDDIVGVVPTPVDKEKVKRNIDLVIKALRTPAKEEKVVSSLKTLSLFTSYDLDDEGGEE